ncbi:Gypsy retrotransposon integrase-like protein [Trichinella pseudospiralis]
MNRTLLDMLAKASIDHPEDWDVYLDRALLAYRTSVHCTTGATPSRVLFDRELRLPVDLMYGVPTDAQVRSAGGVRAAPAQRFGAGVRGGPKESLLEVAASYNERKPAGNNDAKRLGKTGKPTDLSTSLAIRCGCNSPQRPNLGRTGTVRTRPAISS